MSKSFSIKFLKILLICLGVIYWVVVGYISIKYNQQTTSWLLLQSACFATAALIVFFYIILDRGGNSKKEFITRMLVFWLWPAYFGYQQFTKYQRNIIQDQFGQNFNEDRRAFGAPEIPEKWQIDSRWSGSVSWRAQQQILGHISKDLRIDSTGHLKFEDDYYKLKPSAIDTERTVLIRTYYSHKKNSVDSISYCYQLPFNNKVITKQQADSIFTAEGLKKDY